MVRLCPLAGLLGEPVKLHKQYCSTTKYKSHVNHITYDPTYDEGSVAESLITCSTGHLV